MLLPLLLNHQMLPLLLHYLLLLPLRLRCLQMLLPLLLHHRRHHDASSSCAQRHPVDLLLLPL
jgi:hypothetical protein